MLKKNFFCSHEAQKEKEDLLKKENLLKQEEENKRSRAQSRESFNKSKHKWNNARL